MCILYTSNLAFWFLLFIVRSSKEPITSVIIAQLKKECTYKYILGKQSFISNIYTSISDLKFT